MTINNAEAVFNFGKGELVARIRDYQPDITSKISASLVTKCSAFNEMSQPTQDDRELMGLHVMMIKSQKIMEQRYSKTHIKINIDQNAAVLVRLDQIHQMPLPRMSR